MSNQWKPTQKIRATNTVLKQLANLETKVMARSFVTFENALFYDCLINNENSFLYRVEKKTAKTIVLSEGRKTASGYGCFSFGHKPKRMYKMTFDNTYRITSEKEIKRSLQLSARHRKIMQFKIQTGGGDV